MELSPVDESPYKTTPFLDADSEKLDKKDLVKESVFNYFDPKCVRKTSNWSKPHAGMLFDSAINNGLVDWKYHIDWKYKSPKLEKLVDTIKKLDEHDMKKDGHKYKHFIFSDLKSGPHGAKLIATALMESAGMKHGYDTRQTTSSGDKWSKIKLKEGKDTDGNIFHTLVSGTMYKQSLGVKFKKDVLKQFNSRPDNVYGDLSRIIVMDSGYKEGIDLFDVKYVHIFEPQTSLADQKQVIGRATRTCGQKGLVFHPTDGWPLHVFIYDLKMDSNMSPVFANKLSGIDLYLYSLGIDLRLINFTSDLEHIAMIGSVDYELNKNIHEFSVSKKNELTFIGGNDSHFIGGNDSHFIGGRGAYDFDDTLDKPETAETDISSSEEESSEEESPEKKSSDLFLSDIDMEGGSGNTEFLGIDEINHMSMSRFVKKHFNEHSWGDIKMENLCGYDGPQKGGATIMNYTPTQAFIKHYFRPENPIKGMLLYHSVGTGKTCSAIAAASDAFERQGYTILWVTRTTLKNDIWKNMFDQVCSDTIKERLEYGMDIPDEQNARMKLLSKSWSIRPMSYKQFSNMIVGGNSFYKALVKKNGTEDPLRKTLLIIDEAHKLYGGADLSTIERPDMDEFSKAIYNSHIVSGEDSVKLMLMTATPITNDPMELVKLINLCKPLDQKIPDSFESFSEKYLNDDGKFHTSGKSKFLDEIAGHISYLNREKDARQFSQPIIHQIDVPLLYNTHKEIADLDKIVVRDIENEKIYKLNDKLEEKLATITEDLTDLDRNRFKFMKNKCDTIEKKGSRRQCIKIANGYVKDLVTEMRNYIKTVKADIKEVRKDLAFTKKGRTSILKTAKSKYEHNPKRDEFEHTPFYTLTHKCKKVIKTKKELAEKLKVDPLMMKLDAREDAMKEHLKNLIENENIRSKGLKNQLLTLKKSMKTMDADQKKLVEHEIKKTERAYYGGIRKLKNTVKQLKRENKKEIKSMNKLRKTYSRKVVKAFSDVSKRHKETAKNELKLKKQLRKTEDIEEEFKNEKLKNLVEEISGKFDKDLQDIIDRDDAEEKAVKAHKEELKAAKEAEKLAKKEAREAAKLEKKEAAKLAKEAAKEAKMAEKKQGTAKTTLARCPKGTRRNKKTGECEKA